MLYHNGFLSYWNINFLRHYFMLPSELEHFENTFPKKVLSTISPDHYREKGFSSNLWFPVFYTPWKIYCCLAIPTFCYCHCMIFRIKCPNKFIASTTNYSTLRTQTCSCRNVMKVSYIISSGWSPNSFLKR